jgi:hypothetical protein
MSVPLRAGPIAGIARTDGQPLETGPFDSQPSAVGQEITHDFQPMFLIAEPSKWTKTFRWEIPANTGLAPGATLNIKESIPLIYPADSLVRLPISDWHESIVGGDASQFVQWETHSSETNISARIGNEGFPIHGQVSFSADGRTIWFNFDLISIPAQGGSANSPVTLDISKVVVWSGPVLDPIPVPQHLDLFVSEYPTTPEVPADYNQNGIVDAADYTVWRDTLGQMGTGLAADGNGNGMIDGGDYTVWTTHFGEHAGSGSSANANVAVPEPTTLWMLLAGILTMCCNRRSKVS